MNMKVENEMALPTTKSVAVMLLEPYAGKLARTVLRGESSRKGTDLLDYRLILLSLPENQHPFFWPSASFLHLILYNNRTMQPVVIFQNYSKLNKKLCKSFSISKKSSIFATRNRPLHTIYFAVLPHIANNNNKSIY